MDSCKLLFFFILHLLFITIPSIQATPAESKLFREYIGADEQNVTFSDVPINPKIEIHFILSFAIDYTTSTSPPSPTNGDFKANHSNVKVALSLGGDTIEGKHVHFKHTQIHHMMMTVQPYYLALWRKYGHLIDYVNFQFYAYEKGTTIPQFIEHFETKNTNYIGGKVLVSFGTDGSGDLSPDNGFFEACSKLQRQGKLHGIFIWSADDSKKANFRYEEQAQTLLACSR
ncbi:chitinase 2 [Fagus crenata]